jgi:hypothetical protein
MRATMHNALQAQIVSWLRQRHEQEHTQGDLNVPKFDGQPKTNNRNSSEKSTKRTKATVGAAIGPTCYFGSSCIKASSTKTLTCWF